MGIVYQASLDHPLRDSTHLISPGYPGINPRGYSRTSLSGLGCKLSFIESREVFFRVTFYPSLSEPRRC